MKITELMDTSLHTWPGADKIIAIAGNAGSIGAWLLQPSVITAVGGICVSMATTAYFIARTRQVNQRRRHEAQLHKRSLEAYYIQCPDCSAMVPAGAEKCDECDAELPR